jgi:hypothetical protein
MATIKLTNGTDILIDDADYERVSARSWHAGPKGHAQTLHKEPTLCPAHNVQLTDCHVWDCKQRATCPVAKAKSRRTISLTRFLCPNVPAGTQIRRRNGDINDYRRRNLVVLQTRRSFWVAAEEFSKTFSGE